MISVLLLTQAGTIPYYAGRLPPQIKISMIIDKWASLEKKLTTFCMAIYLLLKDWLMDWLTDSSLIQSFIYELTGQFGVLTD